MNLDERLSDAEIQRNAVMSDCGRFRYRLSRVWNPGLPRLTFVMLNPSIADSNRDDPTIRKCIGFAQRLRYGGIHIVNLFAFITSDPKILELHGFPGADKHADSHLAAAFMQAAEAEGEVVCAWGANARHPKIATRAEAVLNMVRHYGLRPKALRILSDGVPSHPLMLSYRNELLDMA